MMRNIQVPDIGTDEVEVTEILVAVGDRVEIEQSLIVVEGDKASMEIPAPIGGVVQQIIVKLGDKVSSNSPIMSFASVDDSVAPPSQGSASSDQQPSAAITEVSMLAASPMSSVTDAVPTTSPTIPVAPAGTEKFVKDLAYVHATPLVRRLAREFGADLTKIAGSGPKGRILRVDLQNYVKNSLKPLVPSAATEVLGTGEGLQLLPWPKVDFSRFGEIEVVELSRINKLTGANLHRNWVMIPHVTQWDSADITELEAFRQQQNSEAKQHQSAVKLTLLVFIMQAVARALTQFPRFNSALSPDGQQLILKKYINIGVAVDTPNGLVVPVIKQINAKGVMQLSQELSEISLRARAGKLTSADLQGSCFTISSLGGIGGSAFTPIINAPEVAILGVSQAEMRPHWDGQEFVARLMLPLSLSYDHRVIDGADGARFITALKQLLSDIRRLLL